MWGGTPKFTEESPHARSWQESKFKNPKNKIYKVSFGSKNVCHGNSNAMRLVQLVQLV
jgi:hypothetical protein